MSEENTRKVDEAVEALENAQTEELEDKPLEDVAGGIDVNLTCPTVNAICDVDKPVDVS